MDDFRFIKQATASLLKIPEDRRELAVQYVWAGIRPSVATVTPATNNGVTVTSQTADFPPSQPEAAA